MKLGEREINTSLLISHLFVKRNYNSKIQFKSQNIETKKDRDRDRDRDRDEEKAKDRGQRERET